MEDSAGGNLLGFKASNEGTQATKHGEVANEDSARGA